MDWNRYKDFSEDEFECRCGCQTCNVKSKFMDRLQKARDIAKTIDKRVPFIISSGCRCKKHNKQIGGYPNSRHLSSKSVKSTAGDIVSDNDHYRAVILIALVKAGFTHIGFGEDFLHADMSNKIGSWIY